MIWHHDDGHGWLAVQTATVANAGVLDRVSHCSFERYGTLYLEEDCDAPRFLRAIGHDGRGLEEIHHRGDAPCRTYRRFNA